MRAGIVLIAFLPFLYYATKDNPFHFRGRKVSPPEHILHLAIGIALLIAVSHAVMGNSGVMLIGLLFFVVAGGLDEYIWHRGIPEVESDLHAKEHLALLIFIVITLAVNWLDANHWRLPPEFLESLHQSAETERTSTPALAQVAPSSAPWWRGGLLCACILPYAYFGLSDNVQHVRSRRVSWAERIVHAAIVLAVLIVVPQIVTGHRSIAIAGLVLFLVARSFDEWVFHRNLPDREADMHAKTHLAFLIFVVMWMTVDWLSNGSAA